MVIGKAVAHTLDIQPVEAGAKFPRMIATTVRNCWRRSHEARRATSAPCRGAGV